MPEILIEVQEIKDDVRSIKIALQQMAELMLKQQQENNECFQTLVDAAKANTEMLTSAFREEDIYTRQLLEQHDIRIIQPENNRSNN